jgi:hypothetical protein
MSYPTIAQRYARLRSRCPVPPLAKRRLSKWDVDDPLSETPLVAGLRRRLAAQLQKPPGRLRTPLIIDLEKRLAARAGLPRSKPSGPVSLGDRSLPEDRADDVPEPAMPPGERMS